MTLIIGTHPYAEAGVARVTGKITVFLIDDHDLVREGLKLILGREPDIAVVGDARSAEEALESLDDADPAVIVLDYRLGGMDGAALCREIAERRFRGRVVILSAYMDEDVVEAALLAGARGYVVKDVEAAELKRAVRAVARGETVIDPKVAGRVLSHRRLAAGRQEGLRSIEMSILRLLVQGMSNGEIARVTGLSHHTVKSYLSTIYEKFGVNRRAAAIAVALRRGIV